MAGDGTNVVRIAVADVSLNFESSGVNLVDITDVEGAIVLNQDGVAASASGNASLAVPGLALANASIELQINTTGTAVEDTFVIGDRSVTLAVEAGPYIRVAALGVRATLSDEPSSGDALAAELTGDLL